MTTKMEAEEEDVNNHLAELMWSATGVTDLVIISLNAIPDCLITKKSGRNQTLQRTRKKKLC